MDNEVCMVATIRPWNIKVYHETIKHYRGKWHLITNPKDLTVDNIKSLSPKFIFFPHWSHIVPAKIIDMTNCVCFHETDLPFGRGGSPLQNLIANGYRETVITALKMTGELDAGPIYLKHPLSLEGLAEEIFVRASRIVAKMIKRIIIENPVPKEQNGKAVIFKRRKPEQSKLPVEIKNIEQLFDHIRMLDASGYPKAYLEFDNFKYEISRPALRTEEIHADIRITKIKGTSND